MAYNENMKSKNDNVTMNGISLYGSESVMNLGYYNGGVSVRICPIKPENERTPKSMYDYNTHTNIVIPKEDVLYLGWMLKNIFLPKMQAGEPYFQGIQIGRSNMIIFSTGSEKSNDLPYVTICRELDPATLRPKEMRRFLFRPVTTLSKYEPEAGEYETDVHKDYDVIKFVEFFIQASNLSGAAYHSYRYEHRFVERAKRRITDSIAGKLGIAPEHPVNNQTIDYGGGFTNVPSSVAASTADVGSVSVEQGDESTLSDLI
jgi:hypothetical protein